MEGKHLQHLTRWQSWKHSCQKFNSKTASLKALEVGEHFDAHDKQHLTVTNCDTASASLERLTKCVTMAAQETLCVKKHQTLRKRCVSNRTRQLYEQRRRYFAKLSDDERRVAKRAISTSGRADHIEHVNGILNDMDAAERCGNSREVSSMTRILSGKRHTRSINPSKDLNATCQSHRTNFWMNGPRLLVNSLRVRTPTRTCRSNA